MQPPQHDAPGSPGQLIDAQALQAAAGPGRCARPWLIVAASAAVVFGLVAWGVFGSGALARWDDLAAAWIDTGTTPAWRRAMALISDLHRPRGIAAATAVAALALMARRDRAAALCLMLSVLGGASLNHFLKQGFARPRPGAEALLYAATDFSFPSGHAANAMLLYATLAALLVWRLRSRALQAALVGIAATGMVSVAASRLILGAHHLSDVLAGAAVGLGWASLCLSVLWCWRGRQPSGVPGH